MPLKTLTVPQLELSACLLLEKILQKCLKSLKLNVHKISLWIDSIIVLFGLKIFEVNLRLSNRATKIQHLADNCKLETCDT